MYRITRKIDGNYACYLMYQDGHENWEECSMEDAIEAMISGAKAWNGTIINANDISFYQEKPIQTTTVEPMIRPDYKPRYPFSNKVYIKESHKFSATSPTQSEYEVVVPFSTEDAAKKFKRFIEGIYLF